MNGKNVRTTTTVVRNTASKPKARKQRNQQVTRTTVTRNDSRAQRRRVVASRRNPRRRIPGGRSSNWYLQALLEPEWKGNGAKVPDPTGFATGTFQLSYDTILSTSATAGNDTIAFYVVPIIGSADNTIKPIGYSTSVSTSIPYNNFAAWPARATIQGAYTAYRPVSGFIDIEYIGATSTDQGLLIGGLVPRGGASPTTLAQALSVQDNVAFALKKGMRVLFRPEDNADWEFSSTSDSTTVGLAARPQLFFIATGLPSGTATAVLKVRVVFNYEAIPTNDTLSLVDVSPSPANAVMLEQALNCLSVLPYAMPILTSTTPYLMGQIKKYLPTRDSYNTNVRGLGMNMESFGL